MRTRTILSLLSLIFLIPGHMLSGQSRYAVEQTPFSSPDYDEFCPSVWEGEVIFSSNMENEFLVSYHDQSKRGLLNIFKARLDSASESSPVVLSKELVTPFNDGPAAFGPEGKTIVYSRNMDVNARHKNIFDLSNNLGIYFAELTGDQWIQTGSFTHNNPEYSVTTPCYSPDGLYLYFASDMPGGKGGTDLYRSAWDGDKWGQVENLGEPINSTGNEVYPFVASDGELYFSSDGHGGLGKKDLFMTREKKGSWLDPVPLEAPMNSPEDDFGLITLGETQEGFLSSNREGSDDIYRFFIKIPQLYGCDTMLVNNYCFEFWDDEFPGLDSLPVVYEWMFSDGSKKRGLRVTHCLPGAGMHWAKLNIIDNQTSNTFFTQSSLEFELTDYEQAFISSRMAGVVDQPLGFTGTESNQPGFQIEQYIWDYGDGGFDEGSKVEHTYEDAGEYMVQLGLKGIQEGSSRQEIRCVQTPVRILKDNQSLAMHLAGIPTLESPIVDGDDQGGELKEDFSVFEVNPLEEVFRVEVLASDQKIMLEDSIFDPLRDQYEIKEFYLSSDNLYSYTVGEYNDLLNTYSIYQDVVDRGFNTASVKTYVLAELPTEVIAKINRDFAEFADANFDFNKAEVSEQSYPILDRVAEIMKENPDLVMEVAAHTDNVGSFEYNLNLSQNRVESIINYLTTKGIQKHRLVGQGYGEARPIASNSSEEGRMKNRRVEFIILNEE